MVHVALIEILDRETRARGLGYHDLRHRNTGDAHSVEFHLLFPEGESLKRAHQAATGIEKIIEGTLRPRAYVTTHLECESDHDAAHGG